MPQFSGFFTAEEDGNGGYDRVYTAEQFAYYFSKFIGNGVYMVPSTQLQVSQSPTPNMSVNVAVGDAYINGYFYKNTTVANLSIEIASGPLNRIDMIVLRWDNLTRSIELKVLKGKEASQATPPTLTRNADVYELCLAKVSVSGATSQITNSSITDTRGDNNLCGFVHGVVSQVDTTTLWQQYATKFEELYQGYNKSLNDKLTQYGNSYQSFVTEYSGKFNTWFNGLTSKWTQSDYNQMTQKMEEEHKKLTDKIEAVNRMVSVNIPITGWVSHTDSRNSKIKFKYDYSDNKCTAQTFVSVVFDISSVNNAKTAGVLSICEVIAGKVTLYAQSKPTVALTANIYFND